jgi:hypothetical protein
MLFFQLKSKGVVAGVCHIGKTIEHTENEQHGGVNAERNTGVAAFHFV